jgi:hypothetical protein
MYEFQMDNSSLLITLNPTEVAGVDFMGVLGIHIRKPVRKLRKFHMASCINPIERVICTSLELILANQSKNRHSLFFWKFGRGEEDIRGKFKWGGHEPLCRFREIQ